MTMTDDDLADGERYKDTAVVDEDILTQIFRQEGEKEKK